MANCFGTERPYAIHFLIKKVGIKRFERIICRNVFSRRDVNLILFGEKCEVQNRTKLGFYDSYAACH